MPAEPAGLAILAFRIGRKSARRHGAALARFVLIDQRMLDSVRALVTASITLLVPGCAGLSSGMPRTSAHPPRLPVAAEYVCNDRAVVVTREDAGRRLWSLVQDASIGGYRAEDGDHFVFFYLTDESGRIAVEYVVPAGEQTPAEVRTYDRRAGARFHVVVLDGGVWTVRGQPSAVVTCEPGQGGASASAVGEPRQAVVERRARPSW